MTVREDPWNPYTRMTQSNCIKRASAWNQLWWLVQPRIHQDRIECKPRMEIRLDETEDICYIFRVQNIVFRVRKQSIIRRQLKMQWENSNEATNKVLYIHWLKRVLYNFKKKKERKKQMNLYTVIASIILNI